MDENRDVTSEFNEVCGDFLAYASDQLPHLEVGDCQLVAYVGRRLDESWRHFDYLGMLWVDARYEQDTKDRGLADLETSRRAGQWAWVGADAAEGVRALAELEFTALPGADDRTKLARHCLLQTMEVIATDIARR